jgi:hypothetical protein
MSDEEPIVVNLNVKQWNHLLGKLEEKYSTDESLSSSEEAALLEFIEPDEEEEYDHMILEVDSEEDYDWATSEDLSD